MYSRGERFMRSREGYFDVYFPSCAATREINTKITLEWVQKQFVTRVHTLFYFLHDITNSLMTLKRGFSHIITGSHSLALRSADDVTIEWWWRHNDQTIMARSRDNLISISIDIDFIHGDIHGRSCKNCPHYPVMHVELFDCHVGPITQWTDLQINDVLVDATPQGWRTKGFWCRVVSYHVMSCHIISYICMIWHDTQPNTRQRNTIQHNTMYRSEFFLIIYASFGTAN